MNIYDDKSKRRWAEIKKEIQKEWSVLTDDELDNTQGDVEAISRLIQSRYADSESRINSRLAEIFQSIEDQE